MSKFAVADLAVRAKLTQRRSGQVPSDGAEPDRRWSIYLGPFRAPLSSDRSFDTATLWIRPNNSLGVTQRGKKGHPVDA